MTRRKDFDPDLHNPFRTPDWRWRRAQSIIAGGRRGKPPADPQIETVIKYLRCNERSLARSRDRMPVLALVDATHALDGCTRWEIEARVLADEPAAAIAEKVDLPVEVVALYESVMFDIRRSLDAHDRIVDQVLRLKPWSSADPPEGAIWGWLGWGGGPVLVDVMTGDYLHRPGPNWADQRILAAKGRVLARMYCTPPDDRVASVRLNEDMRRLWPDHYADNAADPKLALHLAGLDLISGTSNRDRPATLEEVKQLFDPQTVRERAPHRREREEAIHE